MQLDFLFFFLTASLNFIHAQPTISLSNLLWMDTTGAPSSWPARTAPPATPPDSFLRPRVQGFLWEGFSNLLAATQSKKHILCHSTLYETQHVYTHTMNCFKK